MQISWSSIGIEDGRGSVGGIQFSRNNSGAFCSLKTIPSFPNTQFQQLANSNFNAVLWEWDDLDSSEKDSWQAAVDTGDWNRTNSVGDTYTPTAQSLFIQLNLSTFTNNFPIRSGPTYPSFSTISLSNLEAIAPDKFTLSFSGDALSADEQFIIYATRNRMPGNWSLLQPNFRLIGNVYLGIYSNPFEAGGFWNGRFGELITGQAVFVFVQLLNVPTGARLTVGSSRAVVI